MRQRLDTYQAEIRALQAERRRDWWARIDQLLTLIQQEMNLTPLGEQYG
jgi:hypothetical protein